MHCCRHYGDVTDTLKLPIWSLFIIFLGSPTFSAMKRWLLYTMHIVPDYICYETDYKHCFLSLCIPFLSLYFQLFSYFVDSAMIYRVSFFFSLRTILLPGTHYTNPTLPPECQCCRHELLCPAPIHCYVICVLSLHFCAL